MKLMIAGGGTGGHVFTGIALAREWLHRHAKNEVVFVGTEQGMEKELVPKAGYRVEFVPVFGFKRLSPLKKIKALLALPNAFVRSALLLWRERPQVVMGVGGYASLPVMIMAALMGTPTAFIEQNSVPGLANRILGSWARRIFLAFAYSRKFFPREKCWVTGNPVRLELVPEALAVQKKSAKMHVLIFGGSQGAKRLDQAAIDAAPQLKDLASRLSFTHQCRGDLFDTLQKTYAQYGFEAEVVRFVHDMGRIYGKTDLVICRSGALSISEIATLGKAAVLVPYPFAADDHQRANAQALSEQGAAVLVLDRDLTGLRLAEIIRDFVGHPENLRKLETRALKFSSARSAQKIIDGCQILVRP